MEECRRFLNEFGQKSCQSSEEEIIQYRNSGCYITENDLEGEITDWALQYLHANKCPHNLAAKLAHETCDELMKDTLEACEEFKDLNKHEATNGDTKEIIRVFNPRKLLRTVHSKVHDVCRKWMDKEINFIEKSNRLVSVAAIKNSRRRMEDRHLAIPDLNVCFGLQNEEPRGFYAVFDGHAGAEAAAYASAHLHFNIVMHPEYSANLELAIREGFQKTEKDFLEKSTRENLKSGTTVLCAFVDQHKITVAWLGDSQAFLIKNGAPINMVTPHKPDRADEKDRIESLGGNVVLFGTWRVNGVLAVSRAIGDAEHKPYIISEPEIATIPLDGSEDFLILACDGLWDVMHPEDATNIVYSHLLMTPDDLEGISQKLIHIAVHQGSNDNITVQVVFLRSIKDIVASNPQVNLVQLEPTSASSGNLGNTDASESSPIECNESFDLVKNAYNAEMSSQFSPANSLDKLILKPEIASSPSSTSPETQEMLIKDRATNGFDSKVDADKFESDQSLWITSDDPDMLEQIQDQFSIVDDNNKAIENVEETLVEMKENVQIHCQSESSFSCDSQKVQEYFLAHQTEVAHFLQSDIKVETNEQVTVMNSSPLSSFDSKPFFPSPEGEMLDVDASREIPQKEENVSFNSETVPSCTSDSEHLPDNGERLVDLLGNDGQKVGEQLIFETREIASDSEKFEEHSLNESAELQNVAQAASDSKDLFEDILEKTMEQIASNNKELEEHHLNESVELEQVDQTNSETLNESEGLILENVKLELGLENVTLDQNLLLKDAVESLNDVKDIIQSEPMSLEPITVEKIPESLPVADDVVDDESEDGEGWRYYHPDSISSDSGKGKADQPDVPSDTKELSSELNVSLSNDAHENGSKIESLKLESGEPNACLEDQAAVGAEVGSVQTKDLELKLELGEGNGEQVLPNTSTPNDHEEGKFEQLTDQPVKSSGAVVPEAVAATESPVVKTMKKPAKSTPPGKTMVRHAEKLGTKSDTRTTKSPSSSAKVTEKKPPSSKFVPPVKHDKVPAKLGTMKNVSSVKSASAATNESGSKPQRPSGMPSHRPKPMASEPKVDSTDSKSSGTLPKRSTNVSAPKSNLTTRTLPKPKLTEAKTSTIRKTLEKPQTGTLKSNQVTNVAKKPPSSATGTLRQSSQAKPLPKTTSSVTSSSKITKDTLNKRISSSTKEAAVGVTNVDNTSKNEVPKSRPHTNTLRTETTKMTSSTVTRKVESTLTKSRTGKEQVRTVKKETTVSGTIRKLPTKPGVSADRKTKPANEAKIKAQDSMDKKSTTNSLQNTNDRIDSQSPKEKLNANLVCSEKGSLDESTKEMPTSADTSLLVELSSGDSAKIEEKLDTSHHSECGAGGDNLSASSVIQ